jgi:hypothetical protein
VARGLLTRFAEDSDFGSDICLRKEGSDPATGVRHLEEVAFFVVSPGNERLVKEKARLMSLRGVRRIFTVWVDRREVLNRPAGRQRGLVSRPSMPTPGLRPGLTERGLSGRHRVRIFAA